MVYYTIILHDVCIVIKHVFLSKGDLSFPVPRLPSLYPCPRILVPFVPAVAEYLEFTHTLLILSCSLPSHMLFLFQGCPSSSCPLSINSFVLQTHCKRCILWEDFPDYPLFTLPQQKLPFPVQCHHTPLGTPLVPHATLLITHVSIIGRGLFEGRDCVIFMFE